MNQLSFGYYKFISAADSIRETKPLQTAIKQCRERKIIFFNGFLLVLNKLETKKHGLEASQK